MHVVAFAAGLPPDGYDVLAELSDELFAASEPLGVDDSGRSVATDIRSGSRRSRRIVGRRFEVIRVEDLGRNKINSTSTSGSCDVCQHVACGHGDHDHADIDRPPDIADG